VRLFKRSWKAADGSRRETKNWWLDVRLGDGRRIRVPALTNKKASEAWGRRVEELDALRQSREFPSAELLRWLEEIPPGLRRRLAKAGLIDPQRAGGLKPLAEHLADFIADAEARGVSAGQVDTLKRRIETVLKRAGCRFLRDLSATRVQAAIAAMGKATKDDRGLSNQTLLHYVRACRQFTRWLQSHRRTAEDLLIELRGYNPETDRRIERRGFTAQEMTALLASTAAGPVRGRMDGPTRAAAYRLAFGSGLRRNEIRTLTAASFDLGADPPTVTVKAGYSKHRREDVQPLPVDVAAILADFLPTADPDRPFPLPDNTAEILRGDMATARAAWIGQAAGDAERKARADDPDFLMPVDSQGLTLDFHSFRHGYITAVCKAPVSPRVMMALARHSDPRLTMKRYSRVATADAGRALDALPTLTGPGDHGEALRATGTDNGRAEADARTGEQGDGSGPHGLEGGIGNPGASAGNRCAPDCAPIWPRPGDGWRIVAKAGEPQGRQNTMVANERNPRPLEPIDSQPSERQQEGTGRAQTRRGAGAADRAGFENQ